WSRAASSSSLFPYTTLFRSNRRRRMERLPSELLRRVGHQLGISGGAQRRHGILALPRAFIYVAGRIEPTLDIARFTGNIYEGPRSEEHPSELQPQSNLVCRL